MIFRMGPIIPRVRIVNTNGEHIFYRKTHTQFNVPADIELGPRQVVRGGERHSIGATNDQRPLERANTAIAKENSNCLENLDSDDDRRSSIMPSNLGPPAVTAVWSLASPVLPPQPAPQNEWPRQYSPSISSRSRSLPNGCAREARESPCLRWS